MSTPSSPNELIEQADIADPLLTEVPTLHDDASPEQKDEHWFKYVYQGDKMPQLTLRAVLLGGFLGMMMSASNLYTTLTIGWGFGVAITSCVMSYVIWNIVRALSAGGISKMSILENNCMQSTASAAGASTGATIATMFGALLLYQGEHMPWYIVGGFTLLTAAMGCFLAIPMKRQMINHEQLPFPSGIAAAETLRSLYSESAEAVHKAYAMISGIALGALVGVLNTGEGTLKVLDTAHEWIAHKLGFSVRLPESLPEKGFMQLQENGKWGEGGKQLINFCYEPSVLLLGAGMIVGLRVSLTMLVGSALLYLVVTPQLVGLDFTAVQENATLLADPALLASAAAKAGQSVEAFKEHVQDFHPSVEIIAGGTTYHVYRWGLWGGTGLMVFSSLTSLALQWRTVGRAVSGFFNKKAGGQTDLERRMAQIEVPTSWMFIGMIPIAIGMLALQIVAFHISWYAGLIAIAMSFVLSLVACRATGETDTTPIGAMGKVMQLAFAGLHPGAIVPNLASAGIAANSASSSADLLGDLKSGYLLGANPRKQFLAQFIGVFFGTLAIVPVWYLMIPTKAALEKYAAPATNQWYKVAQVLTKGIGTLPESARWALVIGCLVGVALPIIEKTLVPPKYRLYFPSATGLGLSWVVGFNNAIAFALGALVSWAWGKISSKTHETFNIPLASGLVAGESLIKAFIAMAATIIGILTANSTGH